MAGPAAVGQAPAAEQAAGLDLGRAAAAGRRSAGSMTAGPVVIDQAPAGRLRPGLVVTRATVVAPVEQLAAPAAADPAAVPPVKATTGRSLGPTGQRPDRRSGRGRLVEVLGAAALAAIVEVEPP